MPKHKIIRELVRRQKKIDPVSAMGALAGNHLRQEQAGARKRAIPNYGSNPRLNAPGWTNMGGEEGIPDSGEADDYGNQNEAGRGNRNVVNPNKVVQQRKTAQENARNRNLANYQVNAGNPLRMPETGTPSVAKDGTELENNGKINNDDPLANQGRGGGDDEENGQAEKLNDPVAQAKAAGELAREKKEAKEEDEKKDETDKEGLAQPYITKKIKNKICSFIPGFNLIWVLWRFLSGKKLKLDIADKLLISFSSLAALFMIFWATGFIIMIATFMYHPWETSKTLVSGLWGGLNWSAFQAITDLFK
jgi:hypothetical protein